MMQVPAALAADQPQSGGMGNMGLGLEFKEEERERIPHLVFNDFLVKLFQGRLKLFDVF